jgi:hypothetical protein
MTLPNILATAVVLFAVPLNWYVTARLLWLSRGSPGLWVLRAHAFVSLSLAVIVTVFALIFINNDMVVSMMDFETTKIITRSAMLALSIPGLYWLWLVRRS